MLSEMGDLFGEEGGVSSSSTVESSCSLFFLVAGVRRSSAFVMNTLSAS